jgi:hypothetical protein
MPLCLVVIALLALTAVTLMQSLAAATERAQLQKDMIDRDWARHNVEQQIIWRATIEAAALSTRTDFQGLSPAGEQLRSSAGPWDTRSNPMAWKGVHSNTDVAQDRFKIIVQDARGLLDVNYRDQSYLDFMIRTIGFSAAGRRTAVDSLLAKIDSFRTLSIQGDEAYRTRNITGITRKEDLCQLRGWSEQSLCENDTEMLRYVTFGSGVLPNILLTPDDLKDKIGLRTSRERAPLAIIEWEEVQQREGFYDPLQSSNGSGLRFHVWVDDESYGTTSFFALELNFENGKRPFNISQRVDENVSVPAAR